VSANADEWLKFAATYQMPWLTAGCRGGRYRGTVRNIDVVSLDVVDVVVDLTFERATNLSIPPRLQAAASEEVPVAPVIRYRKDLADAPWYTGTCPRFSFWE
jgi:hypothetical protein